MPLPSARLPQRPTGEAPTPGPAPRPTAWDAVDTLSPQFAALRQRAQTALLGEADALAHTDPAEIRRAIAQYLADDPSVAAGEREALTEVLMAEIAGAGPLQPLLDDPGVSEIMVNGPGAIYVERDGRLARTALAFRDAAHLRAVLERLLAPTGRRVDEASPMVDARLPDGSRLNAVLAPVAVTGDAITIRKFAREPFTLDKLVRLGSLSEAMAACLAAAVRGRLSILISGGTGSGKTTLLNALTAHVPPEERLVTIEDAAELQIQQAHHVGLEARPPNAEGRGEITIRALVRNALRMRPDRIIVGEVRGAEALDMLQAMNTGHEGSLTTIHANSPRDALARLETMVLMAGMELPLAAVRAQIASAIDLIVQQERGADGRRRVVRVTEVVGLEEGVITTQDLFVWQSGADGHPGRFAATGIRPRSWERLRLGGCDPGVFDPAGWPRS